MEVSTATYAQGRKHLVRKNGNVSGSVAAAGLAAGELGALVIARCRTGGCSQRCSNSPYRYLGFSGGLFTELLAMMPSQTAPGVCPVCIWHGDKFGLYIIREKGTEERSYSISW